MSGNKPITYRDLLVERNYLKSFSANMVNRFGDAIDALAFAWMVYAITGDRAWSAIIFGLNSLPTIVLMPFAGVLVERFDKRRVMILADLGRAVLVSLVAALYMTGLIRPYMLAISTLLMSTFEAFRIPAGLSLYPRIVPREKYTVATSLSQSASSVFQILGTGAFGIIIAALGLQGAMFINAATFVISALFIASIRLPKETLTKVKLSVRSYFTELKEGFSYFYQRRIIFLICLVGSLIGVVFVPMNAMLTPYVHESLSLGEYALSTISIATLAGTMLGTAIFPMVSRHARKSTLFVAGGIVSACGYIALVLISHLSSAVGIYVALALSMFVMGLGNANINVVVNVAFMEQVEPQYLGRIGGIFNSLASALVPVASFVTSAVVTVVTVNQLFIVMTALAVLPFVYLAFSRLFHTIDTPPTQEESA